MAYQSLQPSPIAAAWGLLSAAAPVAVVTRRLDRACVYSWRTTAVSAPPLTSRAVGSALLLKRYICMSGLPVGGTVMSALLTWAASGSPAAVFPPSSLLITIRCPAGSAKPIGAAAKWSWYALTVAKICVASCARLVFQLFAVAGFH